MSRFRYPFPRTTPGRAQRRSRFPFPQRRTARTSGGRRPMFGLPTGSGGSMGRGIKTRLILALALAAFALLSYYGKPGDVNQVTGEAERVALTEESQEIQLGLQAAPEMVGQHGGPSRNMDDQRRVQSVGFRLLDALEKDLQTNNRSNPYYRAFQFTLLADPRTINAFALPGGQVFITQALYDQFETEGQLAGVLGHEIGHVLSRHSNKRMAQQGLFQGLAGAVGVLGGSQESARMAQMVSSVLTMKYGRQDELESDAWGVRLTALAGYDPRAMIGVMKILDRAAGGNRTPEFFSTHPSPPNRIKRIKQLIDQQYPQGIPPGLQP